MKPFTALLGAAAGTHAADQMALATLPLTATLVLGAGPDLLGLLVAAQSAAWLLVSLPAGTWIDRLPRRHMLIVALALGLTASIVAVRETASPQPSTAEMWLVPASKSWSCGASAASRQGGLPARGAAMARSRSIAWARVVR